MGKTVKNLRQQGAFVCSTVLIGQLQKFKSFPIKLEFTKKNRYRIITLKLLDFFKI